jgi:hypothetical protein
MTIESTREEKLFACAQIRAQLRSQLAQYEIAKVLNAQMKDEKAVTNAIDAIKATSERIEALDKIESEI